MYQCLYSILIKTKYYPHFSLLYTTVSLSQAFYILCCFYNKYVVKQTLSPLKKSFRTREDKIALFSWITPPRGYFAFICFLCVDYYTQLCILILVQGLQTCGLVQVFWQIPEKESKAGNVYRLRPVLACLIAHTVFAFDDKGTRY